MGVSKEPNRHKYFVGVVHQLMNGDGDLHIRRKAKYCRKGKLLCPLTGWVPGIKRNDEHPIDVLAITTAGCKAADFYVKVCRQVCGGFKAAAAAATGWTI